MRRSSLILIFTGFCFIFTYAGLANAGTEKDAITALKKLEARIEAGMSYRDYSPALGEAKFAVNMFLESADAKKNADLTSLIKGIMTHYERFGFAFGERLNGAYIYIDRKPRFSSKELLDEALREQQLYKELLEQYPEAKKPVEEGGAIDRDVNEKGKDIKNLKYGRVLNLNHLLQIIQKAASADLKTAMKYMI